VRWWRSIHRADDIAALPEARQEGSVMVAEFPSPTPSIRNVDFAGYSADGHLQLAAFVKGNLGSTPAWVARFRQNLIVHLGIPSTRFFLVTMPDYFYLWRDAPVTNDARLPDWAVDAAPVLSPYMNDDRRLSGTLSKVGLNIAVSSWLSHLVWCKADQLAMPGLDWLFESGLYEAMRDGEVRSFDD
jgi:hypothetical protein